MRGGRRVDSAMVWTIQCYVTHLGLFLPGSAHPQGNLGSPSQVYFKCQLLRKGEFQRLTSAGLDQPFPLSSGLQIIV